MSPDWSTSSGCREHSQASSGLVLPLSVCSKYLEQLPLSTWNKHLGFFSVLQIGLEANLFSGIAPPHQLYLPANPTLCLLCPPFQLNTFQIWFLVCVFSVSLCSASFGWLILEIVFFFFMFCVTFRTICVRGTSSLTPFKGPSIFIQVPHQLHSELKRAEFIQERLKLEDSSKSN